MATGSIPVNAYTRARNAINSLIVQQLKAVLRAENQPVSGTKSVLVNRLERHLEGFYSRNDVPGFQILSDLITEPAGGIVIHPSPNSGILYSNQPPTGSYGTPSSWHNHTNGQGIVQLNFKDSIFYERIARLTEIQTLKESIRSSHEFRCELPIEWLTRFDRNAPDRDAYKLLLVGACDPVSTFLKLDIAYPHNLEVKINGVEVRGHWKGLKNKPGTTKPVDITEYIRKTQGFANSLTVTYALTTKKFYLRVDLVKERSTESLVRKLRGRKIISKEQVLRDMRNKAMDSDIVATSTVMSLKCPITYTRLSDPCRGSQCSHNQCFDAMSYLQLQQQAPTWICPICNKPTTFDNLQVDQYVANILRSVPEDIEQVTISPEGQWTLLDPNGNNRGYPGVKSEDDSDDDELVEISNSPSRRTSLSYAPATPLIMLGTPSPADSREYSSAIPVSSRNGNLKRPHEVVDLTLDSSDDDSPTPKRVSGPTSIPHLTNNHVHHSMSNFANSHHLAPSSVNFPFTQGRPPPPARSYNLPSNDYR